MSALAAKRCTKCDSVRPILEFRVDARYADGHVNWCNGCQADYSRSYVAKNRERIRQKNAEWYAANKERHNETSRRTYQRDPAKHAERVAIAKARDPGKYREKAKLNARRRRQERVDLRLRARVSSQFRYCLATGKGGRATEQLLGYSIDELRSHLERQFLKGMSWENMGEWHIDHIVPLSSFKITGPDDPELRRAWALPNLRPLWAKENMSKSDKRVTLL